MSLFSRLNRTSFAKDENGAVAMMYAAFMVPFAVLLAGAIDYTRAVRDKENLRSSLDAATLSLAHEAKKLTDAELQQRAQALFAANYGARAGGIAPQVTVSRTPTRLSLSTKSVIPTNFGGVVGMSQIEVGARTEVAYGSPKIEVALVLDNTGSMAQNGKMPALKAAANDFIDKLAAKSTGPGELKVSIVPFATQVRVDPIALNLVNPATGVVDPLRPNAGLFNLGSVNLTQWTSSPCVSDRAVPADAAPSPGALYPAQICNPSSLSPMRGLVDVGSPVNVASLKASINAMQPSGATNLTIGLSWGQWTISPGNPMGAAAPFNDTGVQKFIVLLTDGDNTANGLGMAAGDIDNRTRAACAAAKDPAKRTTVFTIRVIDGNVNLLRDCASSPSNYFEAANAAGIQPAFQKILDTILRLRLTA
jgi:Flp pilus assembly protein TadG